MSNEKHVKKEKKQGFQNMQTRQELFSSIDLLQTNYYTLAWKKHGTLHITNTYYISKYSYYIKYILNFLINI